MPNTEKIVKLLENEDTYKQALSYVTNLRNRYDNLHHNSLLLYALAWNATNAAIFLTMLAMQNDIQSLQCRDHFPSSRSTALILAAKTGNTKAAMQLLGTKNINMYIDTQDYCGNTALHYACLMRNQPLIEALLIQRANLFLRNNRGYSSIEYYEHEISNHSLTYTYGKAVGHRFLMRHISDWNISYSGTRDLKFSNYRWFLPNIVLNLRLAKGVCVSGIDQHNDTVYVFDRQYQYRLVKLGNNLKDILQFHLKHKQPIIDSRVYSAMASEFSKFRRKQKISHGQIKKLITNQTNVDNFCLHYPMLASILRKYNVIITHDFVKKVIAIKHGSMEYYLLDGINKLLNYITKKQILSENKRDRHNQAAKAAERILLKLVKKLKGENITINEHLLRYSDDAIMLKRKSRKAKFFADPIRFIGNTLTLGIPNKCLQLNCGTFGGYRTSGGELLKTLRNLLIQNNPKHAETKTFGHNL